MQQNLNMREATIITNPMIAANRSSEVTLSKFLRVIHNCFDSITVFGGNLSVEKDLLDIKLCSFPIKRHPNKVHRCVDILLLQVKMMVSLLLHLRRNAPVFFWIGDKMILPYMAAKLKGSEINYFVYGNVSSEGENSLFTRLSAKIITWMGRHADFVCMESSSVINNWPSLTSKQKRVLHLYTNTIEFAEIEKRENNIGMVCRLAEGKHVLECIQAMIALHANNPSWTLEIIGTGRQELLCKKIIADNNASQFIRMCGWVEQSEIKNIARKWKYLLFPTDTEGMPNGLIEIMGLGIPAICSPVGGICDVVKDRLNGLFLLGSSTEIIKDSVEKAIDISCQCEVYEILSRNAFLEIQGNFSLMAAQRLASDSLRN